MCGICGVVQVAGEPREVVERRVLERMTDMMTHRGPNEQGIYLAPGIALGVRRLSVVDLEGGHQPFVNERGDVWAIQNGEIYNHALLRKGLEARGHHLHTQCDTEVIPHLYEDAGTRFPERMRGMFGVAVWDERRRRAVLVRDRMGIKPLYWAQRGDVVVFASELKSLLASGLVDDELDYDAIDAYLTFGFVPAPRTPLAGVSKLLPGSTLVIEPGRHEVERYWNYPEPVTSSRISEAEYAEGLEEVLEDAVRARLMSDVPLGAMLSGGLDSSLIVALMARNMSEPVKTFSVGFADAGEINELPDARLVASTFATEHHELELSYRDDSADVDELVWCLDEPLADVSALGFEALSRVAASHVTVALSGQGADELLGGYKKHQAAALVGMSRHLPSAVRHAAATIALRGPAGLHRAALTLDAPDPVTRLIEMSGRLGGGVRQSLYRGPLRDKTGAAAVDAVRAAAARVPDDPLPVTLHIDAQLALVDSMLHYFDRTSMAHSLEVRVPFLDHHVVEYCARIPGNLKVRRMQTKYLLKRVATGILPDQIVHKRKLGFLRGSTGDWLQAQLRSRSREVLLGSELRCSEFLDENFVRHLASAHSDGTDFSNTYLLTAILMLETWLRSYVSRARRTSSADHELIAATV